MLLVSTIVRCASTTGSGCTNYRGRAALLLATSRLIGERLWSVEAAYAVGLNTRSRVRSRKRAIVTVQCVGKRKGRHLGAVRVRLRPGFIGSKVRTLSLSMNPRPGPSGGFAAFAARQSSQSSPEHRTMVCRSGRLTAIQACVRRCTFMSRAKRLGSRSRTTCQGSRLVQKALLALIPAKRHAKAARARWIGTGAANRECQ